MALGMIVTYTLKPGKREDYLAAIAARGIQKAVEQEDGCLQYHYFSSVRDPDQLLLLERWRDRSAQQLHMKQPHMAALAELKSEFVENTALLSFELE